MRIRAARSEDAAALYAVALATGAAGQDASSLHRFPDLLGEVYVGPYLAYAPEHAFVLADDTDQPQGYALGVPDTRAFEAWARREWWPTALATWSAVPEPTAADAELIAVMRQPELAPPAIVGRYPAHGHIDLAPAAQGRGFGRALMQSLLDSLAAAGGIHLGVDPDNTGALAFYAHLGFDVVLTTADAVFVARTLSPR